MYEFRMPGVRTQKDDEYLCYAEDFTDNRTYITAFEALRDPEVTHHMILFSCEEPGSTETYWECDGLPGSHPVCNEQSKIIFSWAKEAPDFKLPPETSLPVGGLPFRYLVLQVHYKDHSAFEKSPGKTDHSGFRLTIAPQPTPQVAGIYLFASTQPVPANSNSTLKMQCMYNGKAVLHPFAFRVHAHSHGVLNKGQVIHRGKSILIGQKSPQEPQTYYPTENKNLAVFPRDLLEAECHMENKENRIVPMGHTRQDEMCNFYMMYSVPLEDEYQLDDQNFQVCDLDPREMERKLTKLEREMSIVYNPDYNDKMLEDVEPILDDDFY